MNAIIATLFFVVVGLGYMEALRWCFEYGHNRAASFLILFLVFMVADSDMYLDV